MIAPNASSDRNHVFDLLDRISPQPSHFERRGRVSFINELRKDVSETGLLQTELWDREINDNRIDHFDALLKNVESKRTGRNEDAACPHRTDRISFVSRRSIFNHPRVTEPCQACLAGDDEK